MLLFFLQCWYILPFIPPPFEIPHRFVFTTLLPPPPYAIFPILNQGLPLVSLLKKVSHLPFSVRRNRGILQQFHFALIITGLPLPPSVPIVSQISPLPSPLLSTLSSPVPLFKSTVRHFDWISKFSPLFPFLCSPLLFPLSSVVVSSLLQDLLQTTVVTPGRFTRSQFISSFFTMPVLSSLCWNTLNLFAYISSFPRTRDLAHEFVGFEDMTEGTIPLRARMPLLKGILLIFPFLFLRCPCLFPHFPVPSCDPVVALKPIW